jgi:hypothetical protein
MIEIQMAAIIIILVVIGIILHEIATSLTGVCKAICSVEDMFKTLKKKNKIDIKG